MSSTNYTDIIRSDTITDKKFVEENGIPSKIIYYCRTCKKIVTPKRIGEKLSFSCDECKKADVSFGSEQSISNYYHIKNLETEKK